MGLGLAATLALAWFAPQDEAPVARSKTTARSARTQPESATPASSKNGSVNGIKPTLAAQQLQRPERAAATDVKDMFRASSWFVPPPPPPPPPPPGPPPPPPPPSAPVLPFIYLGQIVEDQKVQVILARGDRVVTVYVGENIDSNYRVEGLKGGTLTLLYVPLDIKQTLATGVSQ
jgi:hypothetical protein